MFRDLFSIFVLVFIILITLLIQAVGYSNREGMDTQTPTMTLSKLNNVSSAISTDASFTKMLDASRQPSKSQLLNNIINNTITFSSTSSKASNVSTSTSSNISIDGYMASMLVLIKLNKAELYELKKPLYDDGTLIKTYATIHPNIIKLLNSKQNYSANSIIKILSLLRYDAPNVDASTNNLSDILTTHKSFMDKWQITNIDKYVTFINTIISVGVTNLDTFNSFTDKLTSFGVNDASTFITKLTSFGVTTPDRFNSFTSKLTSFGVKNASDFMTKLTNFGAANIALFNSFITKLTNFGVTNLDTFNSFMTAMEEFGVKNLAKFNSFMTQLTSFGVTNMDKFNSFMAAMDGFGIKTLNTFNSFMTQLTSFEVKNLDTFNSFMAAMDGFGIKTLDAFNLFVKNVYSKLNDSQKTTDFITDMGKLPLKYDTTENINKIHKLANQYKSNYELIRKCLEYSSSNRSKYPNKLNDFLLETPPSDSVKSMATDLLTKPKNVVSRHLNDIIFYIKTDEFDLLVDNNKTFRQTNIKTFMTDIANAIRYDICSDKNKPIKSPPENSIPNYKKISALFANFPYLCFEYVQLQVMSKRKLKTLRELTNDKIENRGKPPTTCGLVNL